MGKVGSALNLLGKPIGALGDLVSKYNFDSIKIKETNKTEKLYHTSDSKPMISDEEERLIPQSLSTTTSPDYIFGNVAYELELPKGAKVVEVNNIEDLIPDDANLDNLSLAELKNYTPMNIGKALRDFAIINNLDAIRVKNVFGLRDGETAVINPQIVNNYKVK